MFALCVAIPLKQCYKSIIILINSTNNAFRILYFLRGESTQRDYTVLSRMHKHHTMIIMQENYTLR
jgi:hypothetical protein